MRLFKVFLIAALLSTAFGAIPVLAVSGSTISFSDTRSTGSDLEINCLNGTSGLYEYQGLYNTTSKGLVFASGSVCSVSILPSSINPLTDPLGWIQGGMAYISNNGYTILFILFCLAVLYAIVPKGGRKR